MIRSISQVRLLVKAFEAGSLRPSQWNHRTRLVLGLWYAINPCPQGPLDALRRGIAAHETHRRLPSTYHAGTTAFYLRKIEAFAIAAPPSLGLIDLINALLVSELAKPQLHLAPIGFPARNSAVNQVVFRESDFRAAQSRELRATAHAA